MRKLPFYLLALSLTLIKCSREGKIDWKYEFGYTETTYQLCPAIGTQENFDQGWSSWGHDVYFGANGHLYALEVLVINTASSLGRFKWKYKVKGDEISSPTVGSNGTIYFGSNDGCLYALSPEGYLKWMYKTEGSRVTAPAIDDNENIYFGSGGYLYSLDSNGTFRWKCEERVESRPAISPDGIVYFGNYEILFRDDVDTYYFCAISSDGSTKWKYELERGVESSPAIAADGTIYFVSLDGNIYALNSEGGLKWKYNIGPVFSSSPSIGDDGTIYIGSNECYLYALNPDGSLKWKFQTEYVTHSCPAIDSDGTIYFSCVGYNDYTRKRVKPHGYLYALNPDGTLKWKYKTCSVIGSSPAIDTRSYGTIYLQTEGGIFYAFTNNADGLASSPWPKFGADNQNTGQAR